MNLSSIELTNSRDSYSLSFDESSNDEKASKIPSIIPLKSPSDLMTRRRSKSIASNGGEEKERKKKAEDRAQRAALLHTLSMSSIQPPAKEVARSPLKAFSFKKNSTKAFYKEISPEANPPNRGRKLFQKQQNYFPHPIICPALSEQKWIGLALRKIEKLALKDPELNPDAIIKNFVQKSLKTTTIIKRIKEAQALEDLPFLRLFSKILDPQAFLKTLSKLPKSERRTLIEIMGGKSATLVLKRCLEKKMHKFWTVHIERARALEEACRQCETQIHSFGPGFDESHPISKISHTNIIESFRSIYSPKEGPIQMVFKINGIPVTIPDLSLEADEKRKKGVIEWLIERLNQELSAGSSLSTKHQAQLLFNGALKSQYKTALIAKLDALFHKYGTADLQKVWKELGQDKISKKLNLWVQNDLDMRILENSENLAGEIIDRFEEAYNHQVFTRYIPCYRILQSISFSAYSIVPTYLRKTLCPALFSFERGQPLMKTFPIDDTHYDVRIDRQTGDYEAAQVKIYRFYQHGLSEVKDILLGKVEVHWAVSGSIFTDERTAQLALKKLELDAKESIDDRLKVIKGLGIAISD